MIRLYIDNVEVKPIETSSIMPRYDISKLRSVDAWRTGEEIEVEIESTPEVERLLYHAADMHRMESFNDMIHNARITLHGTTIFEGYATLLATHSTPTVRRYRLRLRDGGAEWAKSAATTTFSKSNIAYDMSLTMPQIEQSWSGNSPVRFLPLQRDSYPKPATTGLYAVEQILMPHDYHPFISIMALVDSIVKDNGYTLKSEFMETELFKRLMMSGAYRTTDSTVAESAMGFKAYRSTTNTVGASHMGMVNLCMPLIANNIGPIVDTIDASAQDDSGRKFGDAYSNGGCLSFVNGEPLFTPTRPVSVAFEYFIHYTTECRMVSSTHLQGFTNIHLSNGCNVSVELQNPHIDRRNNLSAAQKYRLIVFDHEEGNRYKLSGIGENLSEECTVVTPSPCGLSTSLYVRTSTDSTYRLFEGDWALYDGHVERTLTREVSLTIRSPYESVTPTSPKQFNDIYLSGAIEGQQLTIHRGCSMRPLFSGTPGYGDRVTFEQIAHHDINQAKVLEGLMQMFNLCVYSHKQSKSLYIEPYNNFFNGNVVDWREREVDGIWEYEEGAPNCFETTKLCYAGSDGVVKRVSEEKGEYGEWILQTTGYSSKMGTESIINPIFYPTVAFNNSSTTAPSAEILTVGDRDMVATNDYIEPRIIFYHGLCELPPSERWQAYNTLHSYPLASFHLSKANVTLNFSDCDGLPGLHRYYDRELSERSTRGVFISSIKLRPDEYIALLDPATEGANIRSRFRLKSEYGSSLFTLLSIEEYDTENQIAKCRFRRTLTD